MIGSYVTGILGIVTMMIAWVGIQSLWRRSFSDHLFDDDVLAERNKCTNCGCTTVCTKRRNDQFEEPK